MDKPFWTARLPESAEVEVENRSAILKVTNLPIPDFHDVVAALTNPNAPTQAAAVSYTVRWRASNGAKMTGDGSSFAARVFPATADLSWSASVPATGFKFHSTATDAGGFGEFGQERNGIFLTAAVEQEEDDEGDEDDD